MLQSNLKYLWVAIALLCLNSCSYIVGRKTKRVTFYPQTDSVSIITPDGSVMGKEPFSLTLETRRPTVELRAVRNGDTIPLIYKRRVRDFCILEPGLRSMLRWEKSDKGHAYTYPRKLYIDLSKNIPDPISVFPNSRKGWLRINFGGSFINRFALEGRENSIPLISFPSFRMGAEYYTSDRISISTEIGYFGGSGSYDLIPSSDCLTPPYGYFANYMARTAFNNSYVSWHMRRWSFGAGISASFIDFVRSKGTVYIFDDSDVTLESYRSYVLNPIFRANFALRPKSSVYLSYTPPVGIYFNNRTASFIQLGWMINLPLMQPASCMATKNKKIVNN